MIFASKDEAAQLLLGLFDLVSARIKQSILRGEAIMRSLHQ